MNNVVAFGFNSRIAHNSLMMSRRKDQDQGSAGVSLAEYSLLPCSLLALSLFSYPCGGGLGFLLWGFDLDRKMAQDFRLVLAHVGGFHNRLNKDVSDRFHRLKCLTLLR